MFKKTLYSVFMLFFLFDTNLVFANESKVSHLKTKTISALEDQLSCIKSPHTGQAIRAMLSNGFIKEVDLGYDGIPIFIPTSELKVFGHKILYIAGWEREADGKIKAPFWRGPGTSPPIFIAVTLEATLTDVAYKEHTLNEERNNAYSTIKKDSVNFEDVDMSHLTTITCYAGNEEY